MPGIDPRAGMHAWLVKRFSRPSGDTVEDRRRPAFLSLSLLEAQASTSVSVSNLEIEGPVTTVPARLYRPKGATRSNVPLLIYLHFGGCVLGDLDTCHTACSIISERSGCLVLSVAYRLAPEHRFPAALEDTLAAFRWVRANAQSIGADPNRVAVGGDSAGGYLALAASLSLRDQQQDMPCLQLLIYPVVDMDRRAMPITPFDRNYPLSRSDMIWFAEQYMRSPGDADDPRCSVGRAKSLSGLPPTIMVHAGNDLLLAEGLALSDRLAREGNHVTTLNYPSLPHAFTAMSGGVPRAREALVEIANTLSAHIKASAQGRIER
ncbi:MAG: alpha/beta hydrolase [Hyphomicrobium sp.]|nr:alpha/beta hydrolase [Hyphomicrobium sp.]